MSKEVATARPAQSGLTHSKAPSGLDPNNRILSESLLGKRTEVEILHCEEVYRLRRPRGGNLILTKWPNRASKPAAVRPPARQRSRERPGKPG